MPGATNLRDNNTLRGILQKQVSEDRLYAAICASPAVVLGSWGLLKGIKVITSLCFYNNLFFHGMFFY